MSLSDFDFQLRLWVRLRFSAPRSVPAITFECLDFCGVPCGGQFLLKSAWWMGLDSPFLRCLPLVRSPIGRSPVSSVLAVTFEFILSLGFRVSVFGFRL